MNFRHAHKMLNVLGLITMKDNGRCHSQAEREYI